MLKSTGNFFGRVGVPDGQVDHALGEGGLLGCFKDDWNGVETGGCLGNSHSYSLGQIFSQNLQFATEIFTGEIKSGGGLVSPGNRNHLPGLCITVAKHRNGCLHLGGEGEGFNPVNEPLTSRVEMITNSQSVIVILGNGVGNQTVPAIVCIIASLDAFSAGIIEIQHGIKGRGNGLGVSIDIEFLSLLCFKTEVVDILLLFDYPVKGKGKRELGDGCLLEGIIRFNFPD